MKNTVLVVGGAGYIGSHMVQMLLETGHNVVVLDNLSTGYRDAVLGGEFIQGDLGDNQLLKTLFKTHSIDVVMHFAAYIRVGESVQHPAKYYHNNVVNTLNLLDTMVETDHKKFIFSSTAAVYGDPQYVPIDEQHPKLPINPYGKTKLMVEDILDDYDYAYGLKAVRLRYFNAAASEPQARLGIRHEPVTHLIPNIMKAASGRKEAIHVFGDDYDTPDGSCIRDYIHVLDLCSAHLNALDYLGTTNESGVFNLGNGTGFSVKEVIDMAREVTGVDIKVVIDPRREGDPSRLTADAALARTELGWQPKYDSLRTIIEHAWAWEKKMVGEE